MWDFSLAKVLPGPCAQEHPGKDFSFHLEGCSHSRGRFFVLAKDFLGVIKLLPILREYIYTMQICGNFEGFPL